MSEVQHIERIIRGLERCGYHLFAVASGGTLHGYITLLPIAGEGPAATLRTVNKWERRWRDLYKKEHARTIAEHLARTGRTEALVQARMALTN